MDSSPDTIVATTTTTITATRSYDAFPSSCTREFITHSGRQIKMDSKFLTILQDAGNTNNKPTRYTYNFANGPINQGQCITDNTNALILQADGNLIIRNVATVLWQSGTSHATNANPFRLIGDSTGVWLVDSTNTNVKIWGASTSASPPFKMRMYALDGHLDYCTDASVCTVKIDNIFTSATLQ